MAFACRLLARGISGVSARSVIVRRGAATSRIFQQSNSTASGEAVIEPEPATETTETQISDSLRELKDFSLYKDAGKEPFSEEVLKKLHAPLSPDEVEIKPDGLIYLPEIKYRRKLNTIFGPGGWALIPVGDPLQFEDDRGNASLVTREYCLYCLGRYVAQTVGEHVFYSKDRNMHYGKALESAKSNAMMRCCKDLGIASELWDPHFIVEWKQEHALQVWVENVQTKQKKKVWRKKSRPAEIAFQHPWKEVSDNVWGY